MAGKKSGKRSAEEEERLRLEEEARIREEQEEADRLRRIKERKERLSRLNVEFSRRRLEEEVDINLKFNSCLEIVEVEDEKRKADWAWERWMRQDGKPDCDSEISISSYLARCSENMVSMAILIEETVDCQNLISGIKKLAQDSCAKRESSIETIRSIYEMQSNRIDKLTLMYLLAPDDEQLDAESGDIQIEHLNDESEFLFLLWGNLANNPRRREVEFKEQNVKVELKKRQAIEKIALRVFYTKEDRFDIKLQNLMEISPLVDPIIEEVEEVMEEGGEGGDDEEIDQNNAENNEEENNKLEENNEETNNSEQNKKTIEDENCENSGNKDQNTNNENDSTEQNDNNEEEDRSEEECSEMYGWEGVGGVWNINYLELPSVPLVIDNWTIRTQYGDKLIYSNDNTSPDGGSITHLSGTSSDTKADNNNNIKAETAHKSSSGITYQITLPLPKRNNSATNYKIGHWDGSAWSTETCEITAIENGVMTFTATSFGAFRFFVERHPSTPQIDNWLIRPFNSSIEFHLMSGQKRVLFEILQNGKLNFFDKTNENSDQNQLQINECSFETLIGELEFNGMFIFCPTELDRYFRDFPKKDVELCDHAYYNIASIAHLKQIQRSTFTPNNGTESIDLPNDKSIIVCGKDRFFIIEDKYHPPGKPVPGEGIEEDSEIFQEELSNYLELVKREEDEFEPDFEIPKVDHEPHATLGNTLGIELLFSPQHLTLYKLIKSAKLFTYS